MVFRLTRPFASFATSNTYWSWIGKPLLLNLKLPRTLLKSAALSAAWNAFLSATLPLTLAIAESSKSAASYDCAAYCDGMRLYFFSKSSTNLRFTGLLKSGPQNVPEMTPSASSFCAGRVDPSVVDEESKGTLPSKPACLYWRTKLTPRPPG